MTTDVQNSGIEKALIYSEFPVGPMVADYILCGWTFVANDDLAGTYTHHVLPDGCISLVYRAGVRGSARSLVVSGPHVKELRVEVRAGERYWGLKFWPDAGGAILDIDPAAQRGRADLLALRSPSHAQALSAALGKCEGYQDALAALQAFVSARLPECGPLDPAVRQSVFEMNRCDGTEEIGQIASVVGLSPRQLQRRFRARVGLTPKEYARIRRMRVALTKGLEDRPKNWAAVAIETGYADQAHLSRDAAALTGLTPAGFEARVRPIDHRNVDP